MAVRHTGAQQMRCQTMRCTPRGSTSGVTSAPRVLLGQGVPIPGRARSIAFSARRETREGSCASQPQPDQATPIPSTLTLLASTTLSTLALLTSLPAPALAELIPITPVPGPDESAYVIYVNPYLFNFVLMPVLSLSVFGLVLLLLFAGMNVVEKSFEDQDLKS